MSVIALSAALETLTGTPDADYVNLTDHSIFEPAAVESTDSHEPAGSGRFLRSDWNQQIVVRTLIASAALGGCLGRQHHPAPVSLQPGEGCSQLRLAGHLAE
jgi:hypothetical protein